MTNRFAPLSTTSFRDLSERCDQFHDWVIWSVSIKPDISGPGTEKAAQLSYIAEVELNDPYQRSAKRRVSLEFIGVETIKFERLATGSSELSGLKLEQTSNGFRLTCDTDETFLIEATEMRISGH